MRRLTHDHPADDGIIAVKDVSGARVIGVAGGGLNQGSNRGRSPIREDTASARSRYPLSVVEHHVENDLNIRPMQRFNHVTELVKLPQRILPVS
jgi:hypothetical protein